MIGEYDFDCIMTNKSLYSIDYKKQSVIKTSWFEIDSIGSRRDSAACVVTLESDTPRGAGGLMSWAASKAVVAESRRRAKARLG